MRVVVDAAAWSELRDIGTYIAQDSPRAARLVLSSILQTIEQLEHFPLLSRPGRASGTPERVVARTPYIIVFQLSEQPAALVVVAVVHAARQR